MARLFSHSHLRILIITCLAMLTTACGFHLRSNYLLPGEVSHMSLTSFDSYNNITNAVEKQLRLNGVELVTPAPNTANLHLISETDSDRTLSLYQNARAAEYELIYKVKYRVTVPGYDSKSFQVNITRSYLDNPLAALAKSVEKDLILDEMREQAAEQIIRQMATLKAQTDAANATDKANTESTDAIDEQQETVADGVTETTEVIEVENTDVSTQDSQEDANTAKSQ